MANRILGVIVALIVGGSAVYLARPYIDYHLYAATDPRPIEARGDLADYERATIALFEHVSPSVVQVVGRGAETPTTRGEEAQRCRPERALSGIRPGMWSPTITWSRARMRWQCG